jgi:hypothetical protein
MFQIPMAGDSKIILRGCKQMNLFFAMSLICLAVVFCIHEFCNLMRRGDGEFPGRHDKVIWAVAILLTNVFGAFAYWLMRPHSVPRSGDALQREYAANLEKLASKPYEPH